jgi:hypothetical protein
MKIAKADFAIYDDGTISLLRPVTEQAKEWTRDHIPELAMWWAGAVAIEHRYVEDILFGIHDDGLTVSTDWWPAS